MKKLLTLVFAFTLAYAVKAQSSWQYDGPWPDSLQKTQKVASGIHGIVVTPDGKVWIAPWNTGANVNDSVVNQAGKKVKAIPILVYNQDGTLAQRILKLTIKDTIYPLQLNYRGMGLTKEGNVLVSAGSRLFKVNYQTYDAQVKEMYVGASSLTNAVGAENDNIYLAYVLGNYPLVILNPDLTFAENAVDTIKEIGRWFTISKDGNTIYVPRFTGKKPGLVIYSRQDVFSPFTVKDSILRGMRCETGSWDPRNENWLWLSIGSYNDRPASTFNGYEGVYLCFDVRTWKVVDSMKWVFQDPDPNKWNVERNRGLAFYLDNPNQKLYAFLGAFGGSAYPPVIRLSKTATVSVGDENIAISGYTLEQNYPNPFNPETYIVYSLPEAGHVSIKVYDMLGKEIATLVNEYKPAGKSYVRFDASKLASGTYVYRMTVNNVVLTKKMMLIK